MVNDIYVVWHNSDINELVAILPTLSMLNLTMVGTKQNLKCVGMYSKKHNGSQHIHMGEQC
jgi:hypothetical protein